MAKMIFNQSNLAANTTSANLIAGQTYEFVGEDSQVAVRSVSSAAGIKMTVQVDGTTVMDDQEIPFIGTTLIDNEHVIDTFDVAGGSRLLVRLRETAGVATTDILGSLEITPL